MELNIDTFGEVMDKLITEQHVALLIDMPEGTQDPIITGTGIGTVDFYILMAAIRPVFLSVVKDMGGKDHLDAEDVLDGMWKIIRSDCLEQLMGGEV